MTNNQGAAIDLGPIRRWTVGKVLFAENDFIIRAFAVTDDLDQIGKLGWVPHNETEIYVTYISAETARLWDGLDGENVTPHKKTPPS